MSLKTDSFLNKAFQKMFEVVGEKYSADYVKRPGWYVSRTWTQQQEDEFTTWLCSEMKENLKLSEKAAQKEACFFVSNYGWKVKK